MSLIELKQVSKSYKGVVLFENTNLSIEEGKIYGLIGLMVQGNRSYLK